MDEVAAPAQLTLRRLVAIAALLGAVTIGLYQSHSGVRSLSDDFITRYAAAEVAAEGDSPYEGTALYVHELELGATGPVASYDPPILTALFRLLTPLPLEAAAFALNILSLATVGLLGWWCARHQSRMLLAVVVVGVLVASPTRFALSLGAPDIVVLGIVLLLAHHQPVVGLLKPQTGGLVAAGAFATGPKPFSLRRLAIALVCAVAMFGLSAVLAPGATWVDWFDALRHRPAHTDDLFPVQVALTVLGVAVLAWGCLRCRATGRTVDLMGLSCAACSLLAVFGSWNGYWHLAHVLPLVTLLLAARERGSALPRWQGGLLLVATAAAMGDAYTPNSAYGTFKVYIPVAAVAAVAVALVALEEITALVGTALVILNVVITLLPLEVRDRTIVPVAVSVVLIYLLFEMRPDPVPERFDTARLAAGALPPSRG